MVQMRLEALDQERRQKKRTAVSPRGAESLGGVSNPDELMARQQRQRRHHDQQLEEDRECRSQKRAQQREQQAAIVRNWSRTKEGEAARQKIRDQAHEHRLGWLKSGQVMQKFAWSSEKVQPRFVKLSTVGGGHNGNACSTSHELSLRASTHSDLCHSSHRLALLRCTPVG